MREFPALPPILLTPIEEAEARLALRTCKLDGNCGHTCWLDGYQPEGMSALRCPIHGTVALSETRLAWSRL
jgi:hypothetical protein